MNPQPKAEIHSVVFLGEPTQNSRSDDEDFNTPQRPAEPVPAKILDAISEIKSILASEAHYEKTPTLAYGESDPFFVPVASCDTCHGTGKLGRGSNGQRWRVVCSGCGKKRDDENRSPWLAVLRWNGINLGSQHYTTLPFFGLASLSPAEAKQRIIGIRENLSLRIRLAQLDAVAARLQRTRPPGKKYRERLDAYMQWCMLASQLIARDENGNTANL